MLTEIQIQKNWDDLLDIIKNHCDGDNRWSKLLTFYNKNENRLGLAPASGKKMYHSCFVGGWCSHTLNVYHAAFKLKDLWNEMGAIQDFTDEELAFVALQHDLGKLGTEQEEHYILQEDAWRKKNLGEIYVKNPNISFMKDADRSLQLLQQIGVEVSEVEWLSIKLHAGLYEESNRSYLIAYSDDYKLRTNLPHILHQADLISTNIESQLDKVVKPSAKPSLKEVFKDEPKVVVVPKKSKPSLLDKYK